MQVLEENAGDFVAALTDEQQSDIARCALYHFFTPGMTVCDMDEETSFFFVVLRGSVTMEERKIHHQAIVFNFIVRWRSPQTPPAGAPACCTTR